MLKIKIELLRSEIFIANDVSKATSSVGAAYLSERYGADYEPHRPVLGMIGARTD
jgi:hypothetical protein